MYEFWKLIHMIGVVLLLGNVTVTAFWKVMADRTNDQKLIWHVQSGVIVADWIFTSIGIALILVGGFGAAYVAGLPFFGSGWLIWGEILFALSGLIWLTVLIPLQIKQARAASTYGSSEKADRAYHRDAHSWLVWGIVATVPLVAAIWIMIAKPN